MADLLHGHSFAWSSVCLFVGCRRCLGLGDHCMHAVAAGCANSCSCCPLTINMPMQAAGGANPIIFVKLQLSEPQVWCQQAFDGLLPLAEHASFNKC